MYIFRIVALCVLMHFSQGRNYKLILRTQASFTFSGFMVCKKCHLYSISCFICYHTEHSRSLLYYFSVNKRKVIPFFTVFSNESNIFWKSLDSAHETDTESMPAVVL